MKFNELDVVKTKKPFPKHDITKGEIGTIVAAFSYPNEAYEVEFTDNCGRAKAMIVILPEELDKYEH